MYGLSPTQRQLVSADAARLITALRAPGSAPSAFEQMLNSFSLSTEEGVALMGLAEAFLRVPDDPTALTLVKRQLAAGDWRRVSDTASLWPRLAGRALNFGHRVAGPPDSAPSLLQRLSAPAVLHLARRCMEYLGEQFILGTTLDAALHRTSRLPSGTLFSFDLLGEGARTLADANHYCNALLGAIATLRSNTTYVTNISSTNSDIDKFPHLSRASLSVKLSALEPRYEEAQRATVLARLAPTLAKVFEAASAAGVNITIDAEEQERLELSLDVIDAALATPALAQWTGAGLAVQAYGTRVLDVIDQVAALARTRGVPMHVRLVKGAYWDSEIKRAQERGLASYPVYTRKAATDLSYLAAARVLFEHTGLLWPQFATHNPHTLCALRQIADGRPYELQRLHGMGERLYRAAARLFHDQPPVRVYAPVGDHRALLPYLVRRLLENGANTSFLSQQDDATISPAQLAADPLDILEAPDASPAPDLPLPTALFTPERRTARAWDLGRSEVWQELCTWHAGAQLRAAQTTGPCISGDWQSGDTFTITSPANPAEVLGTYRAATFAESREALRLAHRAQRAWSEEPADARAHCLERAADLFEANAPGLLPLLVREAGKCWPEAIAELRECIDFCRYYAARGRELGRAVTLPGPTGESNKLAWHGRGVFYCISPWNFPLAIFIGQITAALVAGNAVLAKPAPQTPLIAAAATRILFEAGVPPDVLQFLPGDGRDVSDAVLTDSRLAGVAFTGSTATAKLINRAIAASDGPLIPFIAETGGLNAMIVDSTALTEQVVDDVITSAFRAAGQRCSSLRLLCLQDDIADSVLTMLKGAMDTLHLGDPAAPTTDIGPLIDRAAIDRIEHYLATLPATARILHRIAHPAAGDSADVAANGAHSRGHFLAPTLIELASVGDLTREIFGPVLHVVRYAAADLALIVAAIEATDYGLTLGIHTRLSERALGIIATTRVGNTYVNRNMVGAVVGVQPFGGEGLSGTGPKAGGPHYLQRFAVERVVTTNDTAWGGNLALLRGSSGL